MPAIVLQRLESLADSNPDVYEILKDLTNQLNQVMPSILSGTNNPQFGGNGGPSSPGSPAPGVAASPGTVYLQRNSLSGALVIHVKDSGYGPSGWAETGAWGSIPPTSAGGFQAVAQPTQVTFYYDGTNGSQVVTLSRANGELVQIPAGKTVISGLLANTTYFFYPYYDERLQSLQFVQGSAYGSAVGAPAAAYTSDSSLAAQQMRLTHRIPLTAGTSISVTTPNVGSSPSSVGGGFGGRGRLA